jgi:hypothetical protein
MLASGRLRVEPGVHGPSWLGLLGIARTDTALDVASGATLGGFLLLAVSTAVVLIRRPSVRWAGVVGTVSALPLLIGPPVGSLDVYAYAGQGQLLTKGIDPFSHGVRFAGGAFVAAADPRWRKQGAPYGPLAMLVSHGAAWLGGDSVGATVVVLRVVAVVAVVVSVLLAARLAVDPVVAVAVGTSPLVLVTLVSAAHHEALMGMFVLGALLAHRSGHRVLALVLAALAAAVKLPGVVALGALVCLDLAQASSLPGRVRSLGRAVVCTVAVWGILALLVPDEFGWVSALSTPGNGKSPQAPAVMLLPGSKSHWRAACEALAVVVVAVLLLTVRRRPVGETVGWGLLAVGLLGPVLYPWYLAAPAMVLATTANGWARRLAIAAGLSGPWLAIPRIG